MASRQDLVKLTSDFFQAHWGQSEPIPEWDFSWGWTGPVPSHDKGGIYALFRKEELLYIGLGNSRGSGIYSNRGISNRLLAHVIQIAPPNSSATYEPRTRWQDLGVSTVGTLGFPHEVNYLALALEDYLIARIDPPENVMKRSKASG